MAFKQKRASSPVIPYKTTINLAMRERHQATVLTLVIGISAIALISFLTAKWGVIDQQARLTAAETRYNAVHAENEATKDYVSKYSDVLREYRIMSKSGIPGFDDEETVYADRKEILDIVEAEMQTKGIVESIRITDNTLEVSMSAITLSDVSHMLEAIEQYPIVKRTAVNSAKTDDNQTGDLLSSVSVSVFLKREEAEK